LPTLAKGRTVNNTKKPGAPFSSSRGKVNEVYK